MKNQSSGNVAGGWWLLHVFCFAGLMGVMGFGQSVSELSWEGALPNGKLHDLLSVTHDGRKFIAVGDSGVILTSGDGVDWKRVRFDSAFFLHEQSRLSRVKHVDGSYFAFGETTRSGADDVEFSSPDGFNWIVPEYSSNQTAKDIAGQGGELARVLNGVITYANGVYVWGSRFGQLYYGADGENWTAAGPDTGLRYVELKWIDGYFYAVASQGTLARSTDGVVWETVYENSDATLYDIARFRGELYVLASIRSNGVVSATRFLVSSNGLDWKERLMVGRSALLSLAADERQIVAVGRWGQIVRSLDGEVWRGDAGVVGYAYRAANEEIFLSAGSDTLFYTRDGAEWFEKRLDGRILRGLVWFEGKFMSYDAAVLKMVYSQNGLDWTEGPSTPFEVSTLAEFKVVGGKLFYLGDVVAVSSDGEAWTVLEGVVFDDVAWGNERFVANRVVAGEIMVSADGLAWTAAPSVGVYPYTEFNSILFYGDRFYAILGSDIHTSLNGEEWISAEDDLPHWFMGFRLHARSDELVFFDFRGVVAASGDGLAWQLFDIDSVHRGYSVIEFKGKPFLDLGPLGLAGPKTGRTHIMHTEISLPEKGQARGVVSFQMGDGDPREPLLLQSADMLKWSPRLDAQMETLEGVATATANTELGKGDVFWKGATFSLSSLHGVWDGWVVSQPIGECELEGNDGTKPVTFRAIVGPEGELSFFLQDFENGTKTLYFEGTIDEGWNVALTRVAAPCQEGQAPQSFEYKGSLQFAADSLYIEITGTETPCEGGCQVERTFAFYK